MGTMQIFFITVNQIGLH